MKLTPLFITVGSLAALSVVVHFATKPATLDFQQSERVGHRAVPAELLREVQTIVLDSEGGEAFTLRRDGSGYWRLADDAGLPVDSGRLARLSSALADNEAIRYVTSNEERIERLGIGQRRLSLNTDKGHSVELHLGKTSTRGGIYTRFDDEEGVYLLRKDVTFDTDPKQWRDDRILDFTSRDVSSFKVLHGDDEWVFSQAEGGSSFTTELELEGYDYDAAKVRTFVGNISSLRYLDYVEAEDAVALFAEARRFELTHRDGRTLVVEVVQSVIPPEEESGVETTRTYVRYEGDWLPAEWKEPTERLIFEVAGRFWNQTPGELSFFFRTNRQTEEAATTEDRPPIPFLTQPPPMDEAETGESEDNEEEADPGENVE